MHFHVCAVDGVFEEVPGGTDAQSSPPGIAFNPASAIDETAVAQAQADLRRRILRAFVGRGLLESCDAKEMLGYQVEQAADRADIVAYLATLSHR